MRSHGGTVTVDSTPGKGSSFALYFPAAKEMAQKEEAGAAAAQALVTGRRVLYVDDEEALVLLASRVLSRLAGARELILEPSTMDELARVLDAIPRARLASCSL